MRSDEYRPEGVRTRRGCAALRGGREGRKTNYSLSFRFAVHFVYSLVRAYGRPRRPKRPPRSPQDDPRGPQEGLKRAQWGFKTAQVAPKTIQETARMATRWPQGGPREPQYSPQIHNQQSQQRQPRAAEISSGSRQQQQSAGSISKQH